MKILAERTRTADEMDKMLKDMFGSPAPPKEEILRHKWLESEKAGRDIGVVAAAHDWRIKYYAHWKEFQFSPESMIVPSVRPASRRQLEVLTAYVVLPLALALFGLALLQWTTGFDYTDYISPPLTAGIPGYGVWPSQ
ncbi:MAG TPA: hypothetical protein VMP11_17530 [Verrucomicrobiae bacterium]|nr:hypothetical protein [Verrucomicrobiae bacterium]